MNASMNLVQQPMNLTVYDFVHISRFHSLYLCYLVVVPVI